MSAPRATARETALGEVELICPYREGLVEALKEIPARYRSWDADERVWRVHEPHAQVAVDLLLEHFPSAAVPEAYRRVTPVVVPDDGPTWAAPWWDAPTRDHQTTPRSASELVVAEPASQPVRESDELAPLLAGVCCPRCGDRREIPVRVVTQTGEVVAKRELITPELLTICSRCSATLILAFVPAPERVAS